MKGPRCMVRLEMVRWFNRLSKTWSLSEFLGPRTIKTLRRRVPKTDPCCDKLPCDAGLGFRVHWGFTVGFSGGVVVKICGV